MPPGVLPAAAVDDPALPSFLGDSDMGRLIGAMDWSATPLGPVAQWSSSLRTTVSLCLASNFPINIIWGPDCIQIYNDGYRVVCGEKHPAAMGMDYRECWASAWSALAEPFDRAIGGDTSFLENQRMFLFRNGYLEETFFTFSLSPIRDETGNVGGLFHPVTETTQTMLAARRTRAVRDLTTHLAGASTRAELAGRAIETLAGADLDIHFVLIYEFDIGRGDYRLAARHGIEACEALAPAHIAGSRAGPWSIVADGRGGATIEIDQLRALGAGRACGPYEEAPDTGFLTRLYHPGADQPAVLFVAGASARLPMDDNYRSFFELVAAAYGAATNRVAIAEDERRRVEALASADRAKTMFFANVSHEFRTPLTLMLGPLEEALASATLPDAARQQLDVVHRNTHRLLKLVNSLLDFSRIEAGRVEATFTPVDLAALTAELASNFRSACERAGLALDVACEPLAAPFWVDPDMWEKIVLNLLSNAFKFTFKGSITVSLRASGNGAFLEVADSGVGIPAAELARVFERFHRVEGQASRSAEGSGIGLSLVRELVQLHHGDITVHSEPGRGTSFLVYIPSGHAHLPAAQVSLVAQPAIAYPLRVNAYADEVMHWLPDDAAPVSDRPAPAGRPRIVVVDDNADMRAFVRRLLDEAGFEVTVAGNGRAALALILDGPLPDMVVSDVMMPELDGFGLLAALRQAERTRDVQVLLLSAKAGEEARLDALKAGADEYMVKPFNARELVARIEGALRLAQQRRDSAIREESLRSAGRELRAAADRKDEFLAMLAHELRNPLAPIQAATELIGMAELDPQRLQEANHIIHRQVAHMSALVDDLLDVSRVTRGLVAIDVHARDIGEVARAAIEQARPLIDRGGHRFDADLPAGQVLVLGDQTRLVQVVTNLLNNAAKYTPPGGVVALSVRVDGSDVVLQVTDNGIGIPADMQARVFEPFEQAERGPDRAQGGLGLGLALVKSMVELHGGEVRCDSAGIGKGTTFTVRLPRVSGHALPADTDALPVLAKAERSLRILVVDDNVDAAMTLAMLLEFEGHEIQVAHEPYAALECAATYRPDVCVLDIGLPHMDGNELARRLKADANTAHAVLIALTGYGLDSDRETALAAGFDHFFTKPVDIARLSAVLQAVAV